MATDSRALGAPSLQPTLSRYSVKISSENANLFKRIDNKDNLYLDMVIVIPKNLKDKAIELGKNIIKKQ